MDKDGFIYGFHIHSFLELAKRKESNPYNRNKIPTLVICKATKYNSIVKKWDKLNIKKKIIEKETCINAIENTANIISKLPLITSSQLHITNIFQKIDFQGYQTHINWLYNKPIGTLKKFVLYLYQYWNTRLGLNNHIKNQIMPDTTLFDNLIDDMTRNRLSKNRYRVLNRVLDILDVMLSTSTNVDNINTACIIIIYALHHIDYNSVTRNNSWIL